MTLSLRHLTRPALLLYCRIVLYLTCSSHRFLRQRRIAPPDRSARMSKRLLAAACILVFFLGVLDTSPILLEGTYAAGRRRPCAMWPLVSTVAQPRPVMPYPQAALDAASAGDEIRVAAGVYEGVSSRGGTMQAAYVDKSITLRGGYRLADWTTRSGQQSYHPGCAAIGACAHHQRRRGAGHRRTSPDPGRCCERWRCVYPGCRGHAARQRGVQQHSR